VNRYEWEVLLRASLKTSDRIESSVLFQHDIWPRTAAIASKTLLPCAPQFWFGRNTFSFEVIRAVCVMSAFTKFKCVILRSTRSCLLQAYYFMSVDPLSSLPCTFVLGLLTCASLSST